MVTRCLETLHLIVGLLQSLLLLGACAGALLPGSGIFSASVVAFLGLCVVLFLVRTAALMVKRIEAENP